MSGPFRAEKHFCFFSSKEMISFCNELRKHFALPKFEQELKRGKTETAKMENDDLVVSVLHTLEPEGLAPLDRKRYPKGCNYSVQLKVKEGAPGKWDEAWLREKWLPRWIALLDAVAGTSPLYLDGKRLEEESGGGSLLGRLFGGRD